METASEIKYKTLFLDKFPIKYKNFSKIQKPLKVINVGVCDVDFGFEKLNKVNVKLIDYPKFRLVELKKREFKISIGLGNLNSTIFLQTNGFFEYEIQRNIKNNRFENILEFFIKLFSGAAIKFNLKNIICDLEFSNFIEKSKFEIIRDNFEKYKELSEKFNFNKNKDFSDMENSFYEIYLSHKFLILKEDKLETWINSNIENDFRVKVGDKLILKRVYKLNFKNLDFDILENIIIKEPISSKEILNNKIKLNRKFVNISIEKINKV